ncbi:DUF790 family protein [Caldisphaera sp.]|jgi:predicted nuclease of restriction endonuclease-like RecB superfamily|uniref:DUF790 family protein n=1 Tax=Caldisphaera sp. TaxID=2060322 RepID=UPI00397A687A
MFSNDLLRVKYRKDKVYIEYIGHNEKDLIEEIASLLKENLSIGEFKNEIKYLRKAYDPKLVEGLSILLLRKSIIENKSPIDPRIIRSRVYSYGPIVDDLEKEKILKKVKEEIGVDPLKYIFADLEEEMVIKKVPKLDPDNIIREYNFELLQTALMKTLKVDVYISDKWKELLFTAKRLGLMYDAYNDPFRIEFYGPASMLRLTERYGRSISMLLPQIVSNRVWKIKAEFVGKYNRTYILDTKNDDAEFPLEGIQKEVTFDSSIEKDFYSKMKIIAKDWEIIREPQPLIVNNAVFIPDFMLSKNNINIYVEIVGFWTKEYLRRKSEKVREIKLPLILIIDESLGYDDFNSENVIKFKKTINIAAVYYLINKIYNNMIDKIKINDNKDIYVKENVISYDYISKKFNVPRESIKEGNFITGYTKLKNYLIKNEFLEELKKENFNNKRISELVNKYGEWITEVLDYLGYQVKWINITDAIVKKIQ